MTNFFIILIGLPRSLWFHLTTTVKERNQIKEQEVKQYEREGV